jgi:hypothetical protein
MDNIVVDLLYTVLMKIHLKGQLTFLKGRLGFGSDIRLVM